MNGNVYVQTYVTIKSMYSLCSSAHACVLSIAPVDTNSESSWRAAWPRRSDLAAPVEL
jgi:hypothetical protein